MGGMGMLVLGVWSGSVMYIHVPGMVCMLGKRCCCSVWNVGGSDGGVGLVGWKVRKREWGRGGGM